MKQNYAPAGPNSYYLIPGDRIVLDFSNCNYLGEPHAVLKEGLACRTITAPTGRAVGLPGRIARTDCPDGLPGRIAQTTSPAQPCA